MFHEPVLLSSAKFHRKPSVIRSLVRLYSASAVASAGWVASTVGCASVDASAATGWLDSVARETALGACAAASIATEIRVSMGVGLAVSSSSGGIGRRVDADAERGSGFLIGARLASEQSGVVGARAVAFTLPVAVSVALDRRCPRARNPGQCEDTLEQAHAFL